jgi:hypothetical protein
VIHSRDYRLRMWLDLWPSPGRKDQINEEIRAIDSVFGLIMQAPTAAQDQK